MDNLMSNPYTGIMSKFSSSFQLFIKDIGDAKSKMEEDLIFSQQIMYLKASLSKPGVTSKELKENIVRMIHCEMLGYDVSFGYMEVVKFAQQQNLLEKRIAYAALSIFLNEKNEMERMMNMSSIQRDLRSSNIYEICFGLTAASKLVFKDMLHAVLQTVADLMKHRSEIVRKKAVMTMLQFYHVDKEMLHSMGYMSLFHNSLCDRDPSVMSVTLNAYLAFVNENPSAFKYLTSSFVTIWKQVLNHKLPKDLNHKGVPSPWIQIKLLQILAMLGSDDVVESKKMYEILKECLDVTDTEQAIGCCVVYECIKTVGTIYPNRALLEFAAVKAGLFLVAKSNNLKYVGIASLNRLIHVDTSYAVRHQLDVIDCLSDQDVSIKRKTLDLLFRMTNTKNVKVISNEFIKYLRLTTDDYVKSDLVTKITTLAEKFSPDNEWFIDTMNEVFELGGDLVQPDVAYNMMRIIGEGIEDEDETDDLRRNAVITYTILLQKPRLPDILIQVICWVVGEYIDLLEDYNLQNLIDNFYELLFRRNSDPVTQSWVVTALAKILSRTNEPHKNIKQIDMSLLTCDARQRYQEMLATFSYCYDLEVVLPYDGSCEDIEVDSVLSFLDGFVNEALRCGARKYSAEIKQNSNVPKEGHFEVSDTSLRTEAYPDPKDQPVISTVTKTTHDDVRSSPSDHSTSSFDDRTPKKPSKPSIWTKDGRLKNPSGETDSGSDVMSLPSNESASVDTSDQKTRSSEESDIKNSKHLNVIHQPFIPDAKKELVDQLFSSLGTENTSRFVRKDGNNRGKKVSKTRKNASRTPELLIGITEDLLTPVDGISAESTVNTNENTESASPMDMFENLTVTENHDILSSSNKIKDRSLSDHQQISLDFQQNVLSPAVIVNEPVNLLEDLPLQRSDANISELMLASTLEKLNHLAVALPDEYRGFKHSTPVEICKDMNLRVMCQYVYKPTELSIILYVLNQSVQTLTELSLDINIPSNLRCSENETNVQKSILDTMISFNHVINCSYQSPALHMVLTGHVTYKDYTCTEKRLFLNHVLSTSTILRERILDVDMFQEEWKNRTLYQKKEKLDVGKQMDAFLDILQNANIHPVQVIGKEVITSSSVLNSQHILMHVKLAPHFTEIWIKSKSRLLNDTVLKMLRSMI